MSFPKSLCRSFATFAFGVALLPFTTASATERRFAFTYETTTLAKGAIEFENQVTWKSTGRADRFDFRHEIEYGVTDRFQAALYVADWTVRNDSTHHRSARFENVAAELIYSLSNPVTDWIGSALYGEVTVGDRLLELEGKLLLQKNFGPVVLAYNGALEAEFEGAHLDERTGEMQNLLGVSYEFSPKFTVGAEVLHETEWPGWGKPEKAHVWAGPNVSVRAGRYFAVLTPLIQLTDVQDEPDLQTRLVFGFNF